VDHALLTDWIQVYALPTKTVRLDSTSVSVYHDDPPPTGLLRRGHSKDHRPDLAQFKAMLASLDPLGLPVAAQIVPGNRADDTLYIPAYEAAVATLGTVDVLVVGDSKMGARATRAHSAANESAYLCAYRPAGATATDEITGWIEEALAHPAHRPRAARHHALSCHPAYTRPRAHYRSARSTSRSLRLLGVPRPPTARPFTRMISNSAR